MSETTTIAARTLDDIFNNRAGTTLDGWTHVTQEEGDKTRWHRWFTFVLKDQDGQFWGIDFARGATEEQESEIPWRAVEDAERLDLIRLYPHTVTRTEYRPNPPE